MLQFRKRLVHKENKIQKEGEIIQENVISQNMNK